MHLLYLTKNPVAIPLYMRGCNNLGGGVLLLAKPQKDPYIQRNSSSISVSHNRNDITWGETEKIEVKNYFFMPRFCLLKSTWERYILIDNCQVSIEFSISNIYLWLSLCFSDLEAEKGNIIAVLWNLPPVSSTKGNFTNRNNITKKVILLQLCEML